MEVSWNWNGIGVMGKNVVNWQTIIMRIVIIQLSICDSCHCACSIH